MPHPRRRLRCVSALVVMLLVVGGAQAGMAAPSDPGEDVGEMLQDEPADVDLMPDGHVEAIAAYWRERDAAFSRGGEAGATYVASRLHPDLGYSVEECLGAWFPEGVPGELSQKVTLDEDTVAPAPEWEMPYGPLHDTELTAPVYRMHVQTTLTGLPSKVDVDQTVAVHLAVVDGRAYGFAACIEPSVARTIMSELVAEAPTAGPVPEPSQDTIAAGPQMSDPGVSLVPPPDAPPPPAPSESAAPAPAPGMPLPPEEPPVVPVPPPAEPDPISPPPIPWPTFPPSDEPGPREPTTPRELTFEEELYIVLVLIDGFLRLDLITVDEAIDLFTRLLEAPELDDDHRALVEKNLELLRDHAEDPQGDPPKLHLRLDPETGEVMAAADDDEQPTVSQAVERATDAGCELSLDVMDAYRTDCSPEPKAGATQR